MKIDPDSFEMTCSAYPSQWDAKTTDGDYVYIRYRWGWLTVTAKAFTDDEVELFTWGSADPWDGVMSTSELSDHLVKAGLM